MAWGRLLPEGSAQGQYQGLLSTFSGAALAFAPAVLSLLCVAAAWPAGLCSARSSPARGPRTPGTARTPGTPGELAA